MAGTAFTDSQLSSWAQSYEKELCAKNDLITDRISLAITIGINEYEIPNYVTNIRSVLFQGRELYAKGFSAARMTGDTPFQTEGSIPFEYTYSGKGLRVLKFYPTPMVALAYYSGNLWTPDADQNACIVEFYRTPDYTTVPPLTLPAWNRQYLLKDYVCWKAFMSGGPQQDLRAADYYNGRVAAASQYIGMIKENMHAATINVLFEKKMVGRKKPGRPVLPPNFGYPVNW
jgi:hypothetical protein